MSIQQQIMLIVESRGYGPWYQWQAWQEVADFSAYDIARLVLYLDKNYPPRDLTRTEEV